MKREERSLRPRRSSDERKTLKKKCVTRCNKSERWEECEVKAKKCGKIEWLSKENKGNYKMCKTKRLCYQEGLLNFVKRKRWSTFLKTKIKKTVNELIDKSLSKIFMNWIHCRRKMKESEGF